MPSSAPVPESSPTRLLAITFLMGLAQLLMTSDLSLVNVALPTIGRDLGLQPALLSWVVSANATMFAGFLIIGGRLTDALGHRRCLGLGLILFAIGSLLSGLSSGIWMLIASRALQGLGAALTSPASFSLINSFLPEGPARHRALGFFAVMQGLSVIIGLVLGGILTTKLGWRSVFFINLPIVGVCLALTAWALPPRATTAGKGALDDVGGAILIAVSTGLLLSALSKLSEHGLTSTLGLGLLAAAVVGYVAFFILEGRHRSPLIPPHLFGDINLVGGFLSLTGVIAAFGGLFVMTSVYLQNGLHVSAASTGVMMLPVALATMAAGWLAPILMRRWSMRAVAVGALGLEVSALLLMTVAAPFGQYLTLMAPLLFLAVFGSATAFMGTMGLASAGVRADEQGAASGMLFTGQQIGLPAGVVITLAIFQAFPPGASEGGLAAYGRAFLVPAMLVALGLLALLMLTRRGVAGQPVVGH